MPEGAPNEVGRRIRAALILADRTAEDVAPELNISGRTLNRVIAGERQVREWELGRLSEVLGVPEWFFVDGFSPPQSSTSSEAEREEIEANRHRELLDALRQLSEQLAELAVARDRAR